MASSSKRSSLIMFDEEYDGDTKVYTASRVGGVGDLFHADYGCHHLSRSDIAVLSLCEVLTEGGPPLYPCPHCTLDIKRTIEVAAEHDDLHPDAVNPQMRPENTGDERPRYRNRNKE